MEKATDIRVCRAVWVWSLRVAGLFFAVFSMPAWAQAEEQEQPPDAALAVPVDTVVLPSDTLPRDSVDVGMLLPVEGAPSPRGDIDTTVFYSAKDSMRFSVLQNTIDLYGDAKIVYGDIELTADNITVDNNRSTISAKGFTDSLGRRINFPVFKEGGSVYETRSITYNFKTRKARISHVVTRQGEGFMHGDSVYKSENDEMYTLGNSYTTCDLAHPHFRIVSKKAKMVPNDKVVTGPFYMEIGDVPMPLGFPFGLFPIKQTGTSGVIFPRYGEEGLRGFFLNDLGYYFDISEYLKLKITADIYSKGAFLARANTLYRKRYAYNGSININYTNNRQSYDVENNNRQLDYNLQWTHSTNSKRAGRFSASVNIASSQYTTNNLLQLNQDPIQTTLDNTTRKLSSNISYSQTFTGTPFALGINLRHNQDLVTKQVDLTLPSLSFNVNNVYPFKNVSDLDFLEKLAIRYTLTASQQLTNKMGVIRTEEGVQDNIVPFDFNNLELFFDEARRDVRHSIPISTSVKLLRYFIATPSINYTENWYFEEFEWGLNEAGTGAVAIDTLDRFGRSFSFSTGVNLTTRIYGTYVFRRGNVKAIRHVVNPSIGYSYAPNFADPPFAMYQTLVTVDGRELKQFRYQGSGPSRQETSSMSFSVGNSFEMKVRSKRDTTLRKVSLLNSLSISSQYNFAADSFNLAPFSLSANTNVLNNKVNINVTATLDPYQYIRQDGGAENASFFSERRINRLVWQDGFSLGRITSARVALGINLSPEGNKRDNERRKQIVASTISEKEKRFLLDHPSEYLDFDIPWNLRINHNLSYTRSLGQEAKVVNAIRFSGDFSLTSKWKITFNSGYDFEEGEITQTNLTINRDLHCWRLSAGWVPFGRFQSYNFTIGVRSGILRDLKLDRKQSFFDN